MKEKDCFFLRIDMGYKHQMQSIINETLTTMSRYNDSLLGHSTKGIFFSCKWERYVTLTFITLMSTWIVLSNGSIVWTKYKSCKLQKKRYYLLSICAVYNIMIVVPGLSMFNTFSNLKHQMLYQYKAAAMQKILKEHENVTLNELSINRHFLKVKMQNIIAMKPFLIKKTNAETINSKCIRIKYSTASIQNQQR